jgi:hypothetical protein
MLWRPSWQMWMQANACTITCSRHFIFFFFFFSFPSFPAYYSTSIYIESLDDQLISWSDLTTCACRLRMCQVLCGCWSWNVMPSKCWRIHSGTNFTAIHHQEELYLIEDAVTWLIRVSFCDSYWNHVTSAARNFICCYTPTPKPHSWIQNGEPVEVGSNAPASSSVMQN